MATRGAAHAALRGTPRVVSAALLSLLLLVPASPAQGQHLEAWRAPIADFSTMLAADVETDGIGGVVAGVVVDGDLVWAEAYGWADRDGRVPMTTASILRTGSISKTVTALLMMQLVDRGVVSLDDPVVRHLPEFGRVAGARTGAPVTTLRHLASHTAGIVREPAWSEAAVGPLHLWESRVIESLSHTRYDSVPGLRYQYSNIGFGALGLALARAAGAPFMELVLREIFEPLGMTGSEFVVDGAELSPRLAVGYTRNRAGEISAERPTLEHAGRGYKVPNGGVYSTVADLGRFLGAIAGVPGLRLLEESSRLEMIDVQTPENPDRGYGLGLSVRTDDNGRTLVGHGGSVAGYNASMVLDPESRIGVVLLRNYGGGSTNLGEAAHELTSRLSEIGR